VTFDHIGLIVSDIETGRRAVSKMLSIEQSSETIQDSGLGVSVQFITDRSGIRYELIAPFGEMDPVSGSLKAGRNILNHVAYRVPDLNAEIAVFRSQGAIPFGPPRAAVAYGGNSVVFFLSPLGFVVELIEDKQMRA
jgi:methylmalonyl-CoA/ethylmalonyl-CoA epimerase